MEAKTQMGEGELNEKESNLMPLLELSPDSAAGFPGEPSGENSTLKQEVKKLKDENLTLKRGLEEHKDESQTLRQSVKDLKDGNQVLKHHAKELENQLTLTQAKILPPPPIAVFKMSRYEHYRTTENDSRGYWQSPSFYTHKNGYKMRIAVFANGHQKARGKGFVSVYLFLLRAKHDATLSWPFKGTVTIELLNQLEDAGHFVCPIKFESEKLDESNRRVFTRTECGRGWGKEKFIHRDELKQGSKNIMYLKDDCLFFRVSKTEVDKHKPWLDLVGKTK